MINRKEDDAGSNWRFNPSWAETVDEIISENAPLEMNIQVKTNYYTETRGLFIHVQNKTIMEANGTYTMVVFLLQNEFVAWQKDYTLPSDQQDIEYYHHMDILLNAINGSYGTQLFNGTSPTDEMFENHYSYQIPSDIEIIGTNPDEETGLSVIAFIMNRDSYEIVQVIEEEVPITY